jgi:Tfp pilus assembly protein PilF
MRAYEAAVQLDPAGRAPVEGLVSFARASGMLAEAEAGFRELLRRDRENPDALVRFGDFLATEKRDLDGAVAQYTQALIWRPNDAATKEKIADIYLSLAAGHLGRREYAHAQARIADARRYVADPASAVAATLRELETRLAEIRGGPLPR